MDICSHAYIYVRGTNILQEAALLGFISFFVAWVVLSFFSSVLLDIVDTCFFCYALDKDAETVTKAEARA